MKSVKFFDQQPVKKIKLENNFDLFKLTPNQIKNTKIYNYEGKIYDELYQEALKLEKEGKNSINLTNTISDNNTSTSINNNNNNNNNSNNNIEKIVFEMKYQTQMGQELGILGNLNELGNWNQDNALRMQWTDGNVWIKEIGGNNDNIEYKFIFIVNNRVQRWEDGGNRILNLKEIKEKIKNEKKFELNQQTYEFNNNILKIISNWNQK